MRGLGWLEQVKELVHPQLILEVIRYSDFPMMSIGIQQLRADLLSLREGTRARGNGLNFT